MFIQGLTNQQKSFYGAMDLSVFSQPVFTLANSIGDMFTESTLPTTQIKSYTLVNPVLKAICNQILLQSYKFHQPLL